MTVGSLFAGIGGFDLGFTRAGLEVSWQVEIDPWCRKVLEKNFPNAERYADIRECGRNNLKPVDVICGGFPCQDISNAGLRAGIEGERSGLWGEMSRIIGELRPKFVLVENVAALLGRGMGRVLGDLSAIGYDAEWEVVSAADVGAPHIRERVWILAYTGSLPEYRTVQSENGEKLGRQEAIRRPDWEFLTEARKKAAPLFRKYLDEATLPELHDTALAILALHAQHTYDEDDVERIAKMFGVDAEAIEQTIRAKFEADEKAAKAAEKPAPAKAAKKPAKKPAQATPQTRSKSVDKIAAGAEQAGA